MRIVAGKYRSRILKQLKDRHTRPTMDRVKESIFNIIGPSLGGVHTLDLFGGSGSLTLEALSRGAEFAVIADNDRRAIAIINDNLKTIAPHDNWKVYHRDCFDVIKSYRDEQFDIIFIDPPYHLELVPKVLAALKQYQLLKAGGCLVILTEKGQTFDCELAVVKQFTIGVCTTTILKS